MLKLSEFKHFALLKKQRKQFLSEKCLLVFLALVCGGGPQCNDCIFKQDPLDKERLLTIEFN
jgi:hypothetical protein